MVRNFDRKAAGSADINSVNASVSAETIWSVRSLTVLTLSALFAGRSTIRVAFRRTPVTVMLP